MFAAAFTAMRTVRFTSAVFPEPERAVTTIVRLDPPSEAAPVRPVEPVTPPPTISRSAPSAAPTDVRAPATTPTTIQAPPVLVEVPKDTGAAKPAADAAAPSLRQLVPMREIPVFIRGAPGASNGGAPRAPAGVTSPLEDLSPAARDSMAVRKPGLPRFGRAARMPGTLSSIPLANGGYLLSMTAISLGGGKIDRSKEHAIDADNQMRLRRLQDRAIWRRDSVRADSLRRDSLSTARTRP
jgi:hypothetical protein